MAVTPEDIAVALGVTAPSSSSTKYAQWVLWISDANNAITWRADQLGYVDPIDPDKRDYVVREAVLAHISNPDNATQVAVSVDDGSVSRSYRSGTGRVSILDDWWALLGLIGDSSIGSFRLTGDTRPDGPHWWTDTTTWVGP